jgi:hypothetical protein
MLSSTSSSKLCQDLCAEMARTFLHQGNSRGAASASLFVTMDSMFSDLSASLRISDRVYRIADKEGAISQDNDSSCKRAGNSDTKPSGTKKTSTKPHKNDSTTSSPPDWLPALLTMVQSTGAPHYPYWPPPHHPGFHGNNAMPFGQSPGFGTGQSPGNAMNGFNSSKATPFGQSGGFPRRQDQTTVFDHRTMMLCQVPFNVAALQHQGNRRATMPPLLSAGKSPTNHLQSVECQSSTSDVRSVHAQFPTNQPPPVC